MAALLTFYLSRLTGNKVYFDNTSAIGRLKDLIVDLTPIRPRVIGARIKTGPHHIVADCSDFSITKDKGQYILKCNNIKDIGFIPENAMYLVKHILDKQIVDIDGRKLVRVNDIRLAALSGGIYVVAVDVGVEGLLRRLGMAKPLKKFLKHIGVGIPGKLILWDEVETVDLPDAGTKLSSAYSKLSTLHPSDMADILEDLDRQAQIAVFAALDNDRAADVLEELEDDVQLKMLESLPLEKAADVLEKMPSDEVADILDEMEGDRARKMLDEMEEDTSEKVRELMEYPENTAGSVMTTDFIPFSENLSVDETLHILRILKPEPQSIYCLYIVDDRGKLVAAVSMRDMVISGPDVRLNSIMKKDLIYVRDHDKVGPLADIISKYNLLAVPVVDDDMTLQGMVVIDDVVYNMLKSRRRI